MTVRTLCGYDDPDRDVLLRARRQHERRRREQGRAQRRALGARRAPPTSATSSAYRIYMVNHEDGHALGHQHAHQCLPGGLAPVMMQQTIGLRSAATGTMCQANPWPYPPGVHGRAGRRAAGHPAEQRVHARPTTDAAGVSPSTGGIAGHGLAVGCADGRTVIPEIEGSISCRCRRWSSPPSRCRSTRSAATAAT